MTEFDYKTCTGCSLLCEDILFPDEDSISHAKNLCRKGLAHYQALFVERMGPLIEGKEASIDQAIEKGAEILRNASAPVIYGWSNCTLEAQMAGLALAEKIGAFVDDPSSHCEGRLMEMLLSERIPSCTLDDVRHFADTAIFWGSDPSSTQPRHLSRFSYFPRGSKRQKSYEEERTCIVVDVRESSTAKLCPTTTYRVPPGEDLQFLEALLAVLDGKIPKFGDKKRMIELGSIIKKTEYGVIFPGPGMLISLQDKMDRFEDLLRRLNEITTFKVLPVTEQYNSRGFGQLLFDRTGRTKAVKFSPSGEAAAGPTLVEAAKEADAILVLGADPLLDLPAGLARAFASAPLIVIDPRRSLTADLAQVVIPAAISGLEAGGTALRTDGVKISFEPLMKSEQPTDEQILTRIMEAI
ncbi:formylmethanofuran dehydrogenase subunit B [Methanothrix sp.]|uniref:formylmethanofuran dehydrogenase subunit B n=1 Tax=Methanothrix sp. TaxID=90426 RepID=UPI001BD1DCE4